jgi:hypothetical protein
VSLRRRAGLERWLRRIFTACLTRRLMVHREQFEELTLLQTWGLELCLAIVGPPQVRNHLSKEMHSAALCHIEMDGELVTLWAVVSSAVESVVGRSPDETF